MCWSVLSLSIDFLCYCRYTICVVAWIVWLQSIVSVMGKRPQLPRTVQSNKLPLREEGYTIHQIADRIGCPRAAVGKIVQSGSFSPLRRSGRPIKTTTRTDKLIKRLVNATPSISSSEIKAAVPLLHNVTCRTIRHHLQNELNMPAWKPLKKPLLNQRMRKQRLEFCHQYKHWTTADWEKVMFSDESTFLQFSSYKNFVRRPIGSSSLDPKYIQSTVKHPPSVMVWGCFSAKGRGGLYFLEKSATMNGQIYRQLLEDHLVGFMEIHGCDIFQHDSAPCYKSKI